MQNLANFTRKGVYNSNSTKYYPDSKVEEVQKYAHFGVKLENIPEIGV